MASLPKSTHRVRRIAYPVRLDLAVRARAALMPRLEVRPYVMIERKRKATALSRNLLDSVNSASYGRQTAYTNDGDKVANTRADSTGGSGGGGGGGGVGGGGGGGGWPF